MTTSRKSSLPQDAKSVPVVLTPDTAAIFAAGAFVSAAYADGVKCGGINSCKGLNACKGRGWTEAKTAAECTASKGKVL